LGPEGSFGLTVYDRYVSISFEEKARDDLAGKNDGINEKDDEGGNSCMQW
jgi:hypothetical protein